MKPNVGPRAVMGNPFVHNIVSPRPMLNMPRVATNGGSLNRVMAMPLNQPSARPIKIPAMIAPNGVNCICTPAKFSAMPFFNSPAATAPDNPRIAPTDRSIPPVRMMSVMPMERQRFTEICSRMFRRFGMVRNCSEAKLNTTTITTSASNDWNRVNVSFEVVFILPLPSQESL